MAVTEIQSDGSIMLVQTFHKAHVGFITCESRGKGVAGWWNEDKHVIDNNTMVWLGGEAQIMPLQSQHFMQLVVEDAGSRLKRVIV